MTCRGRKSWLSSSWLSSRRSQRSAVEESSAVSGSADAESLFFPTLGCTRHVSISERRIDDSFVLALSPSWMRHVAGGRARTRRQRKVWSVSNANVMTSLNVSRAGTECANAYLEFFDVHKCRVIWLGSDAISGLVFRGMSGGNWRWSKKAKSLDVWKQMAAVPAPFGLWGAVWRNARMERALKRRAEES